MNAAVYRWVLLVFGVLLVARLLGVYNLYFLEEDEISLAAGIAALVRDNVGDLYRYTPQLGYHRIVEWITLGLGGDVSLVPRIMKLWSVIVGAAVPATGLLLFRDQLSLRQRWLVVLVLAINPIIWRSSQYGNTAMASLGFAALAMVFLSNPGGVGSRALGLACFAVAIFVRADAILLGPLFAYLLYRQLGSLRGTLAWLAGLGAVGLVGTGAILLLDPRLDGVGAAVMNHMFQLDDRTQFWEYLIWAMSPICVGLGILGARALSETRPALLAAVTIGCAGPMLFYFHATTTPRYFLLAAVPFAIATAVGIDDVASRLRRRLSPAPAWGLSLGIACLHLFVGLGQFPINVPRGFITDARIPSHDGFMPTGSLLYDTYLRNGFLYQSIRNAGFGRNPENWEAEAFTSALEELASRRGPDQTVILLFDSGWDHAFHYHAQEAGAIYMSRKESDASKPFASETWLKVGDVSLMTIRFGDEDYAALSRLRVAAGDEVWITGSDPFPDQSIREKLAPGLTLKRVPAFHKRFRVFDVVRKSG